MSRTDRAAANRERERRKRAQWRKAKEDSARALDARWDAKAKAVLRMLEHDAEPGRFTPIGTTTGRAVGRNTPSSFGNRVEHKAGELRIDGRMVAGIDDITFTESVRQLSRLAFEVDDLLKGWWGK